MFPIGELVLLPGMTLPINVFEPRYRELLGRVRASGEPFGIPCVLPNDRPGGAGARLALVGSLAHLTEVTYHPDGTALIRVVGGERYRIERIDALSQPYNVAEAALEPLEASEPAWVAALGRQVVARFAESVRDRLGDVTAEVPQDPLLAASFVAANLGLRGQDGQRVLEARTLLERYELLSELIGADEKALN